MNSFRFTIDDVEDDEEDGDCSADDGQGDQHSAQEIFTNSAAFATSGAFAVPTRVLRHRFHWYRVQFLRTLFVKNKNGN